MRPSERIVALFDPHTYAPSRADMIEMAAQNSGNPPVRTFRAMDEAIQWLVTDDDQGRPPTPSIPVET